MAGILDKKTRVIDYILTREGRSQLNGENSLNFTYATVSDKGVEYSFKNQVNKLTFEEAEDSFTSLPIKVSDTERLYIGLEANSTFSDKLNPEYSLVGGFSYPKYTTEIIDHFGLDNFDINSNFSLIESSTTGSFSQKFKSMKILDSFNQIEEEVIKVKSIEEQDFNFDFSNFDLEEYPTILSKNLNINSLKTLKDDPRLFHKNNFKKLVPVNKNGTQLFTTALDVPNFNLEYVFKKYERSFNISENISRNESIVRIINDVELDNSLKKVVLEVTNSTEKDDWIINLYDSKANNQFNKLAAIDLGEFFVKETGTSKHVFLFGKIYKKSSDVTMKSGNDNLLPIYEKEFILSKGYTFVNVFTLVVE